MIITWRDSTTIGATVAVLGMIIGCLNGVIIDTPASWRAATILLIILAIGIYAILGPRFLPIKEPWLTTSIILHLLALILSVLAFIVGHRIGFLALAIVLVGLWVSATWYHMYLNGQTGRREK